MTAGRRASAEFVIPSEADGLPLHARFWPGTSPRGILVLAHGLGEHGGCYDRTAEELADAPGLVDVLAIDFRGHGRSPGRRGFVRRYEDLIGDLRAGLAWAAGRWPGSPRFLLGHSNGGQVALRAVLEGGADLGLDGLVLSNPSLKLVLDVPRPKLWLGRVLRLVAPGVTLGGNLPSEMLSRDPDFDVRRRDDALRHSRVNPALFFGMVEGGPLVAARASEIRLPVLMILGGSDPVVDHRASLALFERLGSPDKTLRIYPEAVHEPFNDLGRERVVADLADWLGARLEGPRDAG